MKIQTYRIIEFEGEIKPGVDIPIVFEFKIFGSKGILKPPYQILIHINEFTGKVVYSECDCIDCSMRRNENCKRFAGKDYKCKHIKQSELELIEDKHLTESEKTYVDMGGFSVDTEGNTDTVLPKTESINKANNNSQQPEVIACQGGGEHTGVTQGYSENGTSDEYPPVDTSSNVQEASK